MGIPLENFKNFMNQFLSNLNATELLSSLEISKGKIKSLSSFSVKEQGTQLLQRANTQGTGQTVLCRDKSMKANKD